MNKEEEDKHKMKACLNLYKKMFHRKVIGVIRALVDINGKSKVDTAKY